MGVGLIPESDYTLDELCEMEDNGVIFAKFGLSKNPPETVRSLYKGLFVPYYENEGKVIDSDEPLTGFTFFKISKALCYLGDYGDQLIILDFHELRRIGGKNDFLINEPFEEEDLYISNQIYIKKVISLGENEAIDYIVRSIDKFTLLRYGSHEKTLRRWGFEKSADYLNESIEEKFPGITSKL
jgi:hypothetical protein